MRRKELEIKNFDEIVDILDRCDTIRIAMNGEDYPYLVPLSFGYEIKDKDIIVYVHGAKEGKKHELIAKSNKLCIEADICHGFVDIPHGTVTCEYESIIAYGKAEKIEGEEAAHGLNLLLTHCNYDGFEYDHNIVNILNVYKIKFESISGKRRKL